MWHLHENLLSFRFSALHRLSPLTQLGPAGPLVMPAKSSPVDEIPTSIIKSCVDVLEPLIARLATLSFREGVFPAIYKTASVGICL